MVIKICPVISWGALGAACFCLSPVARGVLLLSRQTNKSLRRLVSLPKTLHFLTCTVLHMSAEAVFVFRPRILCRFGCWLYWPVLQLGLT